MDHRLLATALLSLTAALPLPALGQPNPAAQPKQESKQPAPPGLDVGAKAPDAELRTMKDEPVKLSSLYGKSPVVLIFYRGGWCPYCNKALAAWQGREADLKAAGAALVAITPEQPEKGKQTIEKGKLGFTVLSDQTMAAAKAFKVMFELDADTQKKYKGYGIDLPRWNAHGTWELPATCTYVIDRAGTIRYAFRDWDYTKRADPDEVLAAVRALKDEPPKTDWTKVVASEPGEAILAYKTIARHADAWYRGKQKVITLTYRDGRVSDGAGHTMRVTDRDWKAIMFAIRDAAPDRPVEAFASKSEIYSSGDPEIPQDKFGLLARYKYQLEAVDADTLRLHNIGKLDGGL